MNDFALKVCARPRFETEAEIKFEVAPAFDLQEFDAVIDMCEKKDEKFPCILFLSLPFSSQDID